MPPPPKYSAPPPPQSLAGACPPQLPVLEGYWEAIGGYRVGGGWGGLWGLEGMEGSMGEGGPYGVCGFSVGSPMGYRGPL